MATLQGKLTYIDEELLSQLFRDGEGFFEREVREAMERRERLVAEMLSRWVSELEPVLLLRGGRLLGLGACEAGRDALHADGRVVVVLTPSECDCPFGWEQCAPTFGRFNCGGRYVMPARPDNCRIFSSTKETIK